MRRDFVAVAVLWLAVTALALLGAWAMDPFPTDGAEEAGYIDHAFRVMTYMAAPVFGLVVAVLAYSIWRWRSPGTPEGDGPPLRYGGRVAQIWLGATSVLAVAVMIYPGLIGLFELRADPHADLEISVTGQRWMWVVEYGDTGVKVFSPQEMVLPADRRVRFDVTATDVLHSFWVPAFRMKVDAVPGKVTQLYVTPTRTGEREADVAYRLQCAELCGLLHAGMQMPVRVVEAQEFDAWLAEKSAAAANLGAAESR